MREFLGLKPWRAHLLMTSMLIAALAPSGPARADETDAPMTLASIQVEQSPRRAELPVPKAAHQVYRLIAGSDEAISSGSAFLVSGKRVVVTSHHAVDRAKNYMLGFVEASGRVRTLGLNLLAAYPQKDLAILEAQEDLPGDALPLAVDYPELGSDLFAIGFPAAADQRLGGEAMQTADFFSPSVVKGSVSRRACSAPAHCLMPKPTCPAAGRCRRSLRRQGWRAPQTNSSPRTRRPR
jgi:hypothetical protein